MTIDSENIEGSPSFLGDDQIILKSRDLWLLSQVPETSSQDRKYFKTKSALVDYLKTGKLNQVGTTRRWGFYDKKTFPVYG